MSLLGVHLTLLLGPTVPAPAPPQLLEALQEVQVTHRDDGPSGFQISFRAGRSSPLDLLDVGLLANPLWLKPFNRVILLATFGAVPQVLMDGFITQRELVPGSSPGASTLQITGEDVSVMMDLEERSAEHPGQSEPAIAAKILLSYARYGITPIIIPPRMIDLPSPLERTPVQQASDRRFLSEMAARFGHVFFVPPGPAPGFSRAYWGPPPRLSAPQRALSVNLGLQCLRHRAHQRRAEPQAHGGLRVGQQRRPGSDVMGFLFHAGAQALCPHGGTVTTFPVSTRVRVSGQPVAVAGDPNQVLGCSFNVSGFPQPCVRVQWLAPAQRVRVGGQPVVLDSSPSQCFSANQFPQGSPTIVAVQHGVKGM